MQLGVADRAVQVGEQARRLVVVERRVEALGHLAREQQRARVPAAMRRQQVLVTDEERPVALRHDIAGVLAGDDESIAAGVHRSFVEIGPFTSNASPFGVADSTAR